MENSYKTLGVDPSASTEEIKRAYKKLAMQHHPDRGGNVNKFQEISEAYQKITSKDSASVPPHARKSTVTPAEMINNMFINFNGFNFSTKPVNQNIRIAVELTIREIVFGCEKMLNIRYSSTTKNLLLNFPSGLKAGDIITFNGFGADTNQSIDPGNLEVFIRIKDHAQFKIVNGRLETSASITVWQAMLGTSINLQTIDDRTIAFAIPRGTQPNCQLLIAGQGLSNTATKNREPLAVNIQIEIPTPSLEQEKLINDLIDLSHDKV